MKKLLCTLSPVLFILPAVINTIVVLWVWIYPWIDVPSSIQIPWQMLLVLSLFWGSGILLGMGKWYGGILGAMVPGYAYMQSLSSYSGMSHIDWLPIMVITVAYYAVCGLLAYRLRK